MKRSFPVRRDLTKLAPFAPANLSQSGAGGCIGCGAGAESLSRDQKKTYLFYGFGAAVVVGGIGFVAGNSIMTSVALIGLFGSVLGLGVVAQSEDPAVQEQGAK